MRVILNIEHDVIVVEMNCGSQACYNTNNMDIVNSLHHNHGFSRPKGYRPLKNIVRKGENAGNQHFLLFPQCFY